MTIGVDDSNERIELYYWNKKEAFNLMRGEGLQLPNSSLKSGFIHSIDDNGSIVKKNYTVSPTVCNSSVGSETARSKTPTARRRSCTAAARRRSTFLTGRNLAQAICTAEDSTSPRTKTQRRRSCAILWSIKEDLAQVSSQLHEWLTAINAKSSSVNNI